MLSGGYFLLGHQLTKCGDEVGPLLSPFSVCDHAATVYVSIQLKTLDVVTCYQGFFLSSVLFTFYYEAICTNGNRKRRLKGFPVGDY